MGFWSEGSCRLSQTATPRRPRLADSSATPPILYVFRPCKDPSAVSAPQWAWALVQSSRLVFGVLQEAKEYPKNAEMCVRLIPAMLDSEGAKCKFSFPKLDVEKQYDFVQVQHAAQPHPALGPRTGPRTGPWPLASSRVWLCPGCVSSSAVQVYDWAKKDWVTKEAKPRGECTDGAYRTCRSAHDVIQTCSKRLKVSLCTLPPTTPFK